MSTPSSSAGYATEYLNAILWRNRITMPPVGFKPNWADKPRLGKYYPDADRIPLPDAEVPVDATLQRGLLPPGVDGTIDFDFLGCLLRDSYGLLSRRLAIHANDDVGGLPYSTGSRWARGTASGGGLYPVSIYWVSGPGGPTLPGVYYYDTARHEMCRLLTGDVSGVVRAALGDEVRPPSDQFLLLGIKFWQNAFKYNSFSYHATTMDIGTLTQTWRMLARARDVDLAPVLWFDELRLNELLGLQPEDEGIFAVVPLPWHGARPAWSGSVEGATVRFTDHERSRKVIRFETLRRIHAATSHESTKRPNQEALRVAAPRPREETEVPLPAPVELGTTVRACLRDRRSSFGQFSAGRPLEPELLASVLAAATSGGALPTESGREPQHLIRLYAFVNHVSGVRKGLYAFDGERGSLRSLVTGQQGEFLQRNYFLANYNVEQAGAVLVVAARAGKVIEVAGDRGYRLVNAMVGATAEATYAACSALGIGCGAALGFDNISYIERLSISDTGEVPLLILMVGHERPGNAGFRYEIA